MNKPKAIIADLDGTLCDHRHRLHFVEPSENISGISWDWDFFTEPPTQNFFWRETEKEWQPDYDTFYEAMDKDGINEAIFNLVEMIYDRYYNRGILLEIICITGRPEKYREMTEKWFQPNFYHYNIFPKLFMRPDYLDCTCKRKEGSINGPVCCNAEIKPKPDHRPAAEVKREIYLREIKDKYEILFVLEDSIECCEMYKAEGLQVLRVM